jgi:hypothetical protein
MGGKLNQAMPLDSDPETGIVHPHRDPIAHPRRESERITTF